MHLFGNSLNKRIEREDASIAPDIKDGDVILFDYRLDHRASFHRNWWAAHFTKLGYYHAVDKGRSNRENTLNTNTTADLANSESLICSSSSALNHNVLSTMSFSFSITKKKHRGWQCFVFIPEGYLIDKTVFFGAFQGCRQSNLVDRAHAVWSRVSRKMKSVDCSSVDLSIFCSRGRNRQI